MQNDPETSATSEKRVNAVIALAQLPGDQRRAVELHHLNGKSAR